MPMNTAINKAKTKVLFVCLGNICRSPTAEGVFKELVHKRGLEDKIAFDSAGTSNYHIGEPPDLRSQKAALKRGIDLSYQKARQVSLQDFYEFDYVIAMDEKNLADLKDLYPSNASAKLDLLLSFSSKDTKYKEVPDPYWSGEDGFELVLDLIEDACDGLLNHIRG